jgi:hypothetical protein
MARDRGFDACQSCRRPAIDHAAAFLAGAGTYVYQPFGVTYKVEIVLDDKQRVACALEAIKELEQRLAVRRMQPGRRFVQHVDHAKELQG